MGDSQVLCECEVNVSGQKVPDMHWVLRETTNFNQKLKSTFKDEGID